MGDIDITFMDETLVRNAFFQLGEQVNAKFIRDRVTGGWCNYCFVEFPNHSSAMRALSSLNGAIIPGTNRTFRLNWASGGGGGGSMSSSGSSSLLGTLSPAARMLNPLELSTGPDYAVFVGDLAADATEEMLLQLFTSYYRAVKAVKVLHDPMTGMAKGYGFVRFFDENEQIRALTEMQGAYCGSRPIRVSMASQKGKTSVSVVGSTITTPTYSTASAYAAAAATATAQAPQLTEQQLQHMWSLDPANTVLVINGLAHMEEDGALEYQLSKHGFQVHSCQMSADGVSAMVQFKHRLHALDALQDIRHNHILGEGTTAVWGKPNPILLEPHRPVPLQELNQQYVAMHERLYAYDAAA